MSSERNERIPTVKAEIVTEAQLQQQLREKKQKSRRKPAMPEVKDPFWPEGAAPTHLDKNTQQLKTIVEQYKPEWQCRKCGAVSHRSKADPTVCDKCHAPLVQAAKAGIQRNSNWTDQAAELGLELFERQPEETDLEWRVWSAYRDYYPLRLPTQTELARKVGCSVGTVVKSMNKWSFKVRLIAWAKYTDADVQEKRIHAIKDMNEKQLTMAQAIQEKLQTAIEFIQPELLKPNELVNLFKVSTELERRVTEYVGETVDSTVSEAKTQQQEMTKPEDISEIVGILKQAGVLDGKTIGVEQATRVVIKEDD